jgi:hypothetical protein
MASSCAVKSVCVQIALIAIYIAVICTFTGCSRDCRYSRQLAKSCPVFHPKKIAVVEGGIDDKEYATVFEIIRFRLRKGVANNSLSILRKPIPLKMGIRSSGREKRPGAESVPRSGIIQSGLLPVCNLFYGYIAQYGAGGSLSIVDEVNKALNRAVLSNAVNANRETKPRTLIFPHRIKLTASNHQLINGDNGERQSECSYAPIRETAAFNGFAKSHRILLFVVSLGISFIGGFWLLFGSYHWAVREPNLVRLLLCLLAGAISFALVFALAHASYAAQNTGSMPSSAHFVDEYDKVMTENFAERFADHGRWPIIAFFARVGRDAVD